ncbi:UNVERIFIED_CONTAM: hypothetical protein GTU68_003155 [Idotea baltica]|nr:hypothetical protein [Idotea baltica]
MADRDQVWLWRSPACGAARSNIEAKGAQLSGGRLLIVWGDVNDASKVSARPDAMAAIQQAWSTSGGTMPDICKSGQIMQARNCSPNTRRPTDTDIDDAMQGNLCRCGTYPRNPRRNPRTPPAR